MERESNPMPMCRSGCGFYGNPAQDGLCSVCFKDALRKKQAPPVSSTPVLASSPVNSSTQTINPSTAVTVPLLSNQSTPTHDHNTAQPTVLLHNQSSADKERPSKDNELEEGDKVKKQCGSDQETVESELVDDSAKGRTSPNPKRLSSESKSPPQSPTVLIKPARLLHTPARLSNASTTGSNDGKGPSRASNALTSPTRSSVPSGFGLIAVKRPIVSKKSLPDESADCAGPSNDDKDGDKDAKKKKNRCVMCNKKVGLTGFECRCGGLFCSTHRYSDKHDCTFDYREHGAAEIRRNNPVVMGKKIEKI